MEPDDIRKLLIELCELVLAGKINFEDFYSKSHVFNAGLVDDIFYKEVFSDLEDGVQHAPGHLFKKGINAERWRESNEYSIILIDKILLEKHLTSAISMKCREKFQNATSASQESIDPHLDKYISSIMEDQD
jgi:hypothetical protein